MRPYTATPALEFWWWESLFMPTRPRGKQGSKD